jgi:hypothetical protein
MGPHEPCPNQLYQFVAPQANWNPGFATNEVSVTHQQIGGAVLTTFKSNQ